MLDAKLKISGSLPYGMHICYKLDKMGVKVMERYNEARVKCINKTWLIQMKIKKEGKSWFFNDFKVIDGRDDSFDPYAPFTYKNPPPVVVQHLLATKGKAKSIDPAEQPLSKQQKFVFWKIFETFSYFRRDMEIVNAKQNKLYDRLYPGALEEDGLVRELGPTFEMPSELISEEKDDEEEANAGETEGTSSRKGKEIVEEESQEESEGDNQDDSE